ncbi:MAG: SRPBCC family protein [SAR202 cluster bacterium]|nr:SRPBCC family protein [SAR202 cluster bacterium]|tara:strand:- start:700 stop:1146 length:447 start_codon:yes stop_codon:yes gene_type:complete
MKKTSEWSLEIKGGLKNTYEFIGNPENHYRWSPYKIDVKQIDKSLEEYKWELDIDLPMVGKVTGYCETIIQIPYTRYKFKGVMDGDDVEAIIIEDYEFKETSPGTILVVRISTLELPHLNGFIIEKVVGSQFDKLSQEVKNNLQKLFM